MAGLNFNAIGTAVGGFLTGYDDAKTRAEKHRRAEMEMAEAQELPGEPESPTGLIPHEVVPRDECLKQPRRRIFRTDDGIAQFGEGHPLGISIENFEDRKSAVQGGSWAGRKSMRSGRGTGGFYIWN